MGEHLRRSLSTFALRSERRLEADIRPHCFNVAEVPEAIVGAIALLPPALIRHVRFNLIAG